jgi:uncharacterized protein YdiU (UPF0061 family)
MSPVQVTQYSQLPGRFFHKATLTPVREPSLLILNEPLAEALGFDPTTLRTAVGLAPFAGNSLLPGSQPIATAYGGHQFGGWSPQLGDGRAMLLGDVQDKAGALLEIQLKGSGPTPFSRGGDGRAGVGPVLREYLISEAIHALGIPTTRSLMAVGTGQSVFRERQYPGAILTRLAKTHARVGTFQYFAHLKDYSSVQALADFVIARCYPEAAESPTPYLALFDAVAAQQISLVVNWVRVGFIHGVMNTDNTTISGETIDYGPCAFLDHYQHDKVFSSIDRFKRYAFGNQLKILIWNLARFAETLVPLIDPDSDTSVNKLNARIIEMQSLSVRAYQSMMCKKIGLTSVTNEGTALADTLLAIMEESRADYTRTFRQLSQVGVGPIGLNARTEFGETERFDEWHKRWLEHLHTAGTVEEAQVVMKSVNPSVIPRNHQVAKAIADAEAGDITTSETLHQALLSPYEDRPEDDPFITPPIPSEVVTKTFCGT